MVQYEELRFELKAHEKELNDLADALRLTELEKEKAELEEQSAQNGFWDDVENSQKVQKRLSEI